MIRSKQKFSPNRWSLAVLLGLAGAVLLPGISRAAPPALTRAFLKTHCYTCHDTGTKEGGLDLEALPVDMNQADTFRTWVKIHDKIQAGEMPPPEEERPPRIELDAYLNELDTALVAADQARRGQQGRAVFRRMNRKEYENSLRDLLSLSGLKVQELLPEDGRAHGFNKVGTALDVSYVQMAKYMEAADVALDTAIAKYQEAPEVFQEKYYPAIEGDMQNMLNHGDAVFLKNFKYDDSEFPLVRTEILSEGKPPGEFYTALGAHKQPVGIFRHEDEGYLGRHDRFSALYPGRYKIRLSAWSFYWDKGKVGASPRPHAVRLNVQRTGRLLGLFDAPSLTPTTHEIEIWLSRGESLQLTPASLWPKASVSKDVNGAAEFVGPGTAFDWLEIAGPLHEQWPPASHRRLFGDLPLVPLPKRGGEVEPPARPNPAEWFPTSGYNGAGKFTYATVESTEPIVDAGRLLADFLPRAFRRPVADEEVQRYVSIVKQRLQQKACFEDAMRTAYKAALCSPGFLFIKSTPGQLASDELAARLSYFLWNSKPDEELTLLAQQDKLREPAVLRAQVERLLKDEKSTRFVEDFLDQWLDLREIYATTPDPGLYKEYHPLLGDSLLGETRAYFRELLDKDLGISHVVDSDFAMLNQKLGDWYEIAGVEGTKFRRVELPPDSHRGGFMTHGSILKVTANGATTSPVKRGVWVLERILGKSPDPPPANVPAIEPDLKGAVTIREQLARHRADTNCAACHAQIDPPGFALESYDVMGGWRDRYRQTVPGEGAEMLKTQYEGELPYHFFVGLPVDSTGKLATGRDFKGIEEFKTILLEDQRQLARNFVQQLLIYSTGTPVSYADREEVEQILDRTRKAQYPMRSLIHEVVQSPLFQNK